jgi:putative flavoprotein involved in K+ transport
MADSPDKSVAAWLAAFEQHLTRGDVDRAMEQFLPESFWRDMVAFTWNIHTCEGLGAIRDMLHACLHTTKPHSWVATGPAREADGIIEAAFSVETQVGRADGVIRLKDGRCWTIMTALAELSGHEEAARTHRPIGLQTDEYYQGRPTWRQSQAQDATELGVTTQPYCLIVGAGHCGLALGARLKHLDVPTLLIDRLERPSDVWRNRYDTLVTNSPAAADHMPYMSFPDTWPAFPSKDQVADWLDAYASIMALNVWGKTDCRSAVFDDRHDEWVVEVVRDGQSVTLRPKHLVFATGFSGPPHMPAFAGANDFPGEQVHSAHFRSANGYAGKRCVVIGADVSGHDIAAALWEAKADVTMVQRSPVIIIKREALMKMFEGLFSDIAVERGMTPDRADLMIASSPLRLMAAQHAKMFADVKMQDAAFYEQLEASGFQLTDGEDHSGFLPQLFRRGAGYYVDVGASKLIIEGKIKLRSRVEVEAITKRGVLLSDGTELPADAIIYATGFSRANNSPWKILPEGARDAVGRIWGYGSGFRDDPGPWDGELRNLWKPTTQRGLWFHMGGFLHSRFYSRLLALQIKARQVGLATPVYKIPAPVGWTENRAGGKS